MAIISFMIYILDLDIALILVIIIFFCLNYVEYI
jgi:hypothetical protein